MYDSDERRFVGIVDVLDLVVWKRREERRGEAERGEESEEREGRGREGEEEEGREG